MAVMFDKEEGDGIGSLRRYFLYGLISIIAAFAAVGILAAIGAATGTGLLTSMSSSASAGTALAAIALVVAAFVFGVLALLGLMFGIRDIRRSSMKGASYYAGVSRWLKWLIVVDIVVVVIGELIAVAGFVIGISGAFGLASGIGSAASTQPYTTAGAVFAVIGVAVSLLFGLKLGMMFRRLSVDVTERWLSISGTLTMAAVVILAAAALIGVANTLTSPSLLASLSGASTTATPPWLVTAGLALDMAGSAVFAAAAFFGWRATKAALA